MNVLITGANGQVGKSFKSLKANKRIKFFYYSKNRLDITNYNETIKVINKIKPEVIINCAAYTDVENSEIYKNLAKKINSYGPFNLAKVCKVHKIFLIHISTDYVFNGKKKNYKENSNTDPINFYGTSKLMGEKNIKKVNCKFLIIRTSWVFSKYGKNFLKTIKKLIQKKKKIFIISDQEGKPTHAQELASIIKFLLRDKKYKSLSRSIINITGKDKCTWYDFGKKIYIALKKNGMKNNCKIEPILTKQSTFKAKRPLNSNLSEEKFNIFFKNKIRKKSLDKAIIQCI